MNSKYRFGGLRFAFFGTMGALSLGLAACAVLGDAGIEAAKCAGDGVGGCSTDSASGTGGAGVVGTSSGFAVPGDFSDIATENTDPLNGLDAGPEPPEAPDSAPTLPFGDDGGVADAADLPIPSACMNLPKDPRVVYMSADDSNSMASPQLIREIIHSGFEPSKSRVRTYEFLNYYRMGYDAPPINSLMIYPEIEKVANEPLLADFQIAVRSFDAPPTRRPMNFTFLVDTSGSMKGPGISRAKDAVKALSSQFVAGDRVSFLTTASSTALKEGYSVTGPNDVVLEKLVDGLTTGGLTDLNVSLAKTYELAKANRDDARMNRVIFISDGGLNVGITDTKLIADLSADGDSEGIYFVGIGVGPALSYNDYLMDKVTDAGRGAYVYLDSSDEAINILAKRFDETMDIAARSVQVELTLPWYLTVEGKSTEGGVTSAKVEAQHLAPSDAMVFLLQTKACDASLYDGADPVRIRVFWKTRDGFVQQTTSFEKPLNEIFSLPKPTLDKGRAIVAFAEALKGCPVDAAGVSTCKNETERRAVVKKNLSHARDLANAAGGTSDPELGEIIGIINEHPLMQ